jgi:phage baseplate assembly protein gpV
VGFVTVLFCLPQVSPVTIDSFNYSVIVLAGMLTTAWLLWITKGRRTYKIPHVGNTATHERVMGDMV